MYIIKERVNFLFALFALCLVLVLPRSTSAQNNLAIGQWRMHIPYNKLHTIAEGNGNIYCASTDGMFIYNKSDGNVTRLTRLEGLSDFSITHIAFSQEYHVLVITYENSNIDLLFPDNTIVNMSDLERADIAGGSKEIHQIYFNGRYAYLSCGFGIAVIDLLRLEIKDTYFLGQGGNPYEVFGTAVYNNKLYAGTVSGIYYVNVNDPLISLYSEWTKDTTLPDPNKPYNYIVNYGNKLIANNDSATNSSTLMQYDGTSWSDFVSPNIGFETSFAENVDYYQGYLIKVNDYSISAFDLTGNRVKYIDLNSYPNSKPRHGFVDAQGIFWVADENNGLVKSSNSGNSFIYPNGPYSVNVYAMSSLNGRLWAAGGMVVGNIFDNTYSKDGVYLFKDNHWTSINRYTDVPIDTLNAYDFITVAIDPTNPDHAFFGSWGVGVFELNSGGYVGNYNQNNSTLSLVPNSGTLRVGGLSFDSDNNLWACNQGVANPISVRKTDGTWHSYPSSLLLGTTPTTIICDSRNRKWILIPWGGGLVVFDENNTFYNSPDLHARKFTDSDTSGALASLNVQCIAEDHDGQIWIGTESGVQVLYSPDAVYSGYINFQQILIQQDGNYQYLLATELVTSMAVDGANRKWFGTASSGVYLISADGTQQIFHFTTDNSPLLSNNIFSIAVDNITGEVFFGTEKGIVSFKGDAIEGTENYENVYVYPNPVRPDYSGVIAVRGLVANANVKITDVSGNLVYETRANGGQATWNGKNFKGDRAHSGVYLVFCSNDDGTKTFVTKLLMMH